ncbi:iron ABC transporter substrate-binding protein [Enterococcus thailandicus]|nr:iron ABC transporter substrate-binding protein [Enterococcus thailandicus]
MLGEQGMKKWMFSFVVVASLLTACGTGNKSEETTATKTANSEETTLTVKDSNGEVNVTKNPQKVVVFDNGSLDTLDALGVGDHVVGAATQNLPAYLSSYKEVESAGGIKEPDLEKINQMKPDLIIISGRQSDFQEELSKIAPTFFLSVDTEKPWESIQQNVLTLGEIFDKESEAKKQIKELSTEIKKTADKASDLDKKALVVLVNEGQLSAYGSGSRFGFVHDVFGFPQADNEIEPSTHGQSVSFEYVLEKNPDLLFVIDRTKAIGGDDSQNNLAENELIAQTNAGKNGKIISLQPDVWYLSGGGLESMKLMLEDVNQAFE